MRRSTLVVCPKVDEPFEGIEIETVHDVAFGGNLAKAWAVGQRLKRRSVDIAVVENHLPAAAVVAAASGIPVILHSHAYEKAASGALKRAERDLEIKRLTGLAFCSEDCLARFRRNFPSATAPMRAIPNGLDMREWSSAGAKDKLILSVGRALDDKGHREAMAAIARVLKTRPEWSARFILSAIDRERETVRALRDAAAAFGERVRIDANLPYAEVKAAWARAAIGMALTKTPEPFGRTALEALASGAALMTSGLGGLAEVCGAEALTVDPTDAEAVATALADLCRLAGTTGEARKRGSRPGRGAVRHARGRRADGRFSRGGGGPASLRAPTRAAMATIRSDDGPGERCAPSIDGHRQSL